MNKQEGSKTRYYVQWDTHARHMCTVLCSLMEHQSLVDLAICCGTNTIHAHKCVLAINSPYFREQLEKNAGTEQVVITGLDFTVVKSIVEFMYCGETNILDENLKYMIAAAKFFQMRGLQTLVSDHQDIRFEAEAVRIPPPIFLPKKPKYPNAYRPLSNHIPPSNFDSFKNPVQNDPYIHRKIKRKFVRSEAEKACAKEAAASRLALEALQKELADTTQMSSFVIEESCTETTVENFIPHSDETFIENLNNIESVPMQVVNYSDLNNSLLTTSQVINIDKPQCTNSVLQYGVPTNPTKDKLKRMLGTDIPGNVEIMFRTSDGTFVNVTDDVLQNLSGGTLQYQIVDENGQVGEIRELEVQDPANSASTSFEASRNIPLLDNTLTQQCSNTEPFVSTQGESFISCPNLELPNLQENINNNQDDIITNDDADVQTVNLCSEKSDENLNFEVATQEDDLVNTITSSSSSSSPGKTSNNSSSSTSSESKVDETDPFIDALNKSVENVSGIGDSIIFDACNMDEFLTLNPEVTQENKENIYVENDQIAKSPPKDCNKEVLSVDHYDQLTPKRESTESSTDLQSTHIWQSDISTVGSSGDNILNVHLDNLEQNLNEDGGGDYRVSLKKTKISQLNKPSEGKEENWQAVEDPRHVDTYSPRKTRSSLRMGEDTAPISLSQCKEVIGDNSPSTVKLDKPRRIMRSRKKKLN